MRTVYPVPQVQLQYRKLTNFSNSKFYESPRLRYSSTQVQLISHLNQDELQRPPRYVPADPFTTHSLDSAKSSRQALSPSSTSYANSPANTISSHPSPPHSHICRRSLSPKHIQRLQPTRQQHRGPANQPVACD